MEQLRDAWKRAAKDLNIKVIVPFVLESAEYVALVPGFGTPKGMLILSSWQSEMARLAWENGYGYSCVSIASYGVYERQLFIEKLTDWGWHGTPNTQPDWYTDDR